MRPWLIIIMPLLTASNLLVADKRISDLPITATFSTNTWIEIEDDAGLPASQRLTLTHLASATNAYLVGDILINGLPLNFETYFTNSFAYFTNIFTTNIAAGHNDLMTVPSGWRAEVQNAMMYTFTNLDAYLEVKTNGNYYPAASRTTLTAATGIGETGPGGMIWDQNETLSLNATVGCAINIRLMLFTNSVPRFAARIYNPPIGTNTIYTVPAGKAAVLVNRLYGPDLWGGSNSGVQVINVNFSGASVTWKIEYIPAGGAVGTLPSRAISTSDNSSSTTSITPVLRAGDSVAIITTNNTASQVFWIVVKEVTAP